MTRCPRVSATRGSRYNRPPGWPPSETRLAGRCGTMRGCIMTGEVLMRRLGKAISVGAVWLAAGLSLFAGVPHFSCVCPDGVVKPVCAGESSGTAGCCCGGGCCASSEAVSCCRGRGTSHAASAARKSCCAGPHDDGCQPSSSEAGAAVRGNCCVRTLEQPEALLFTPAGSTARPDFTAHALPAAIAPPVATLAAPGSVAAVAPGPAHCLSPPPDLLALLQHLLI